MYYGYGYYSSMIVLIPAMIFTIIVQMKLKSTFATYSRVENSQHITGGEAARAVLAAEGLHDVQIRVIRGNALNDYYDPRNNTVHLASEIYEGTSVASIAIACHEVGHAIQHAQNYAPVRFRTGLVPLANTLGNLSWPFIIIGLVLSTTSSVGSMLFNIGTLMFCTVILFHLVTLPVEFNASSRALECMEAVGIANGQDRRGCQKVLRAAAMTYVAALATAVASLLRILLLRGRND